MSSIPITDVDGELNTACLAKELAAALNEDDKRQKEDSMKKRAIHSAGTYDEFRHMVSCAQLTPVTRAEMESLSDSKKGWRKQSSATTEDARTAATRRRSSNSARRCSSTKKNKSKKNALGGKGVPSNSPEDLMEFEKVWRRKCPSAEERREYLEVVGVGRIEKLFRVEMDTNILGQVIDCLAKGMETGMLPRDRDAHTAKEGKGEADELQPLPVPCGQGRVDLCVKWLRALSRTGRFQLNVSFLEPPETSVLAGLFDRMQREQSGGEGALSDEDDGYVVVEGEEQASEAAARAPRPPSALTELRRTFGVP